MTSVVGKLLVDDLLIVDKVIHTQIYLKRFCDSNRRYPSEIEFSNLDTWTGIAGGWKYWVNKNLRVGSFQYETNFPLPFAPGRAKVSEFIPRFYANAVNNPCQLK